MNTRIIRIKQMIHDTPTLPATSSKYMKAFNIIVLMDGNMTKVTNLSLEDLSRAMNLQYRGAFVIVAVLGYHKHKKINIVLSQSCSRYAKRGPMNDARPTKLKGDGLAVVINDCCTRCRGGD